MVINYLQNWDDPPSKASFRGSGFGPQGGFLGGANRIYTAAAGDFKSSPPVVPFKGSYLDLFGVSMLNFRGGTLNVPMLSTWRGPTLVAIVFSSGLLPE